ncbi:MAG: DUF4912 domain-containing protein [Candidatus Omnitrophica bacterium]|nr:DUF4912 domain-containing protein [Candidatus Omnitrophota bacterium]MDD5488569.1 DUF4912 domain-containing protein [Candidatus Omnitrophota bacterium]
MDNSSSYGYAADKDIKKDVKMSVSGNIPQGYGDNKIVLMVRDPWTLHTYWEIRNDVEESVKNKIRSMGRTPARLVLRVYDVTDTGEDRPVNVVYDFDLSGSANSWYVNSCAAGRKWMVAIGLICSSGEFFTLARSNVVKTPNNRMSDIIDEEWMCPEDLYYRMYAIAGGFDVGKSSLELREMIERHLKNWLFSGGISSGMFGSASLFLDRK